MPQALAAILFFHGECVNLKISQLVYPLTYKPSNSTNTIYIAASIYL